MALLDLSGTYEVIAQAKDLIEITAFATSETSRRGAFEKAADARGVDGLVWPTGVQRFGKAPS